MFNSFHWQIKFLLERAGGLKKCRIISQRKTVGFKVVTGESKGYIPPRLCSVLATGFLIVSAYDLCRNWPFLGSVPEYDTARRVVFADRIPIPDVPKSACVDSL